MGRVFQGRRQIHLYLSGFLFLHSTCHFLSCWTSDCSAFLSPPSPTRHPCLPSSIFIVLYLSVLQRSKRRMRFALAVGKGVKTSHPCFALSKSNFFCTAVNSSPLLDALWLPPRCILSQDRIDALFHCKEARA